MFTTGFWTAVPAAELAAFFATWQTETEIPLSDVPDDPSEGTLPEDAPLTDDPEPGQAGGETDPEAETQSGEPA